MSRKIEKLNKRTVFSSSLYSSLLSFNARLFFYIFIAIVLVITYDIVKSKEVKIHSHYVHKDILINIMV